MHDPVSVDPTAPTYTFSLLPWIDWGDMFRKDVTNTAGELNLTIPCPNNETKLSEVENPRLVGDEFVQSSRMITTLEFLKLWV